MNLRFSVPSKTFLVGEYAVLLGAPGLVLTTSPRFQLSAVPGRGSRGIPAGSPASRWLEQHSELVKDWHLEFSDPHVGLGGFGASSAQFLLAHALTTLVRSTVRSSTRGLDLKGLWQDFNKLTSGEASGCDVLAQAVGEVALVSQGAVFAQKKSWPYPDLDFAILRSGKKVATHQHLAELDRSRLEPLRELAVHAVESFGAISADQFLSTVTRYAGGLWDLGLQSENTLRILASFATEPWYLSGKGCGALGADTVLVFFSAEQLPAVREHCKSAGHEIVATMASLSSGIDMNWKWE